MPRECALGMPWTLPTTAVFGFFGVVVFVAVVSQVLCLGGWFVVWGWYCRCR